MTSFRRQFLLNAFKMFDLLIMFGAFSFATIATHFRKNGIPFEEFLAMRIRVVNFILLLLFVIVWHMVFSMFQLYESRRLSNQVREVIDIIKASTTGSVVIVLAAWLFQIEMITPIFIIVFLTTVSNMTIVSRLTLRFLLNRIRLRGHNLRHMLIAGTNRRAIEFARRIESKPELGYRIVGFIDDDWPGITEFQKSGYSLVGGLKQLSPYIRENVVDEVSINLPMKSYYQHAEQLVALCQEQGVIVRQFSDLYALKNGRSEMEELEDESVLTIRTGAMVGGQLVIKRYLDIIISAVALILTTPIFAVSALLIKLSSPGPVLFIQERVGLNKRIFKMYKFRTMVADAEAQQKDVEHLNEVSGPVFKIKKDPRITRIGAILRKTSIDELPQLINILKGEMSLVGPRPLPLRDYRGFTEDWHRRRVSVKPGITCLWQISGRNNVPFERWMELDIQYIDMWSFWIDLKILIKTAAVVIRQIGAN